MEKQKCRFCNAGSEHQHIKGDFVYGGQPHHKFWQCRKCEIIYLYPPHTKEQEEQFYKNEFTKFMADRGAKDKDWSTPEKHHLSNHDEMTRRMRFLKKFAAPHLKVLEIGCSSGFMLSGLKKEGLDVYGIDPSEVFIDYVYSKGIQVFPDLESLLKTQAIKFDLIIHYYVLEHIRKPFDFLNQYMELLSDGGHMVFEVPNASDPLIELYKVPAFDKFYWSIAHHWYFNRKSLTKLLEKTGCAFDIYPEQRYDLSNHIVWMLKGKPGGMNYFNEIWGSELEDMYKQKLKQNWFCDTLIGVLQKNDNAASA